MVEARQPRLRGRSKGKPLASPSTAAPPTAPSAQDVLLATKLRTPRPRTGSVPRPRLVQRLRAGTERELVLVCGPAGFGKTSLLADWVRADRRAVAWLSLDADDNDPVRFWRHVAAALDGVRPGVAERVGALVSGAASTSFDAAVTALVNELAAAPDDVALVVDDYHLIDAPEVHRSLEFLLDHLPAALHLVLASRSDPPLPLARLRARGQLTELRADELRFTPGETAELLRRGDRARSAGRGRRGLGRAHRGLGRRAAAGRAVAAGTRRRHRVRRGVLREPPVRAGLPDRGGAGAPTRRSCGRSCWRPRSWSGCPARSAMRSSGCTNSQQTLESVERASLFLIPLDEERRWWRYHHLFADLLRANLQRLHPARVPELHRAAATWYERHELPDDAIRHALAAGETTWAAQLVERAPRGTDPAARRGRDPGLVARRAPVRGDPRAGRC